VRRDSLSIVHLLRFAPEIRLVTVVSSLRRSLRENRGTDLLVALGVAVLYVAAAKLGVQRN